jgi:hypothetical protein
MRYAARMSRKNKNHDKGSTDKVERLSKRKPTPPVACDADHDAAGAIEIAGVLLEAPRICCGYQIATRVLDRIDCTLRLLRGSANRRMAAVLATTSYEREWSSSLMLKLGASADSELPETLLNTAEEIAGAIVARPRPGFRIRRLDDADESDAYWNVADQNGGTLLMRLGSEGLGSIYSAADFLIDALNKIFYHELDCLRRADSTGLQGLTGLLAVAKVAGTEATAAECCAMWAALRVYDLEACARVEYFM